MPVNLTNIIRVAVAGAIGYLVALLARQGIHLPAGWADTITTLITGAVGTFVFHMVAVLEKRWPWLAWLLGTKPKAGPGGGPGGGTPKPAPVAPAAPSATK